MTSDYGVGYPQILELSRGQTMLNMMSWNPHEGGKNWITRWGHYDVATAAKNFFERSRNTLASSRMLKHPLVYVTLGGILTEAANKFLIKKMKLNYWLKKKDCTNKMNYYLLKDIDQLLLAKFYKLS